MPVDDARVQQWEQDARKLLARYYGSSEPAAHLAAVVLALLRDREDLTRYAETLSHASTAANVCGD